MLKSLLTQFQWRGTWRVALLVLVLCLIFIRLGVWQQGRAAYKQTLADLYATSQTLASVPLNTLVSDGPVARYRLVEVVGELLPEVQFYLDNEMLARHVGYTPHVLMHSEGRYYWVKLGWLALGDDRTHLPSFTVPSGTIHLKARIDLAVGKLPFLPDNDFSQGIPSVLPYLSLEELNQHLSYSIEPILLVAADGAPFGTQVDLASPDFKVNMHRGYALQWFGFAVAVCLIFFGLSFKRTPLKKTPLDDEDRRS